MSKINIDQPIFELGRVFGQFIRPIIEQTGSEWLNVVSKDYVLTLQDRIFRTLSKDTISGKDAMEIDELIRGALWRTEPRFCVRAVRDGDHWALVVMLDHDGHAETLRIWSGMFGAVRAVTVEGSDMVWGVEEFENMIIPIMAAERAGVPGVSMVDKIGRSYMPWIVQCAYKEKVIQGLDAAKMHLAAA